MAGAAVAVRRGLDAERAGRAGPARTAAEALARLHEELTGGTVRVLDDWLLTPQRAAIHLPTRPPSWPTCTSATTAPGAAAARRSPPFR